jgi:hypothetical protein
MVKGGIVYKPDAFCVAVLGTTILGTVGLPIVTGTTQTTGTTTTGFGWCGLLNTIYMPKFQKFKDFWIVQKIIQDYFPVNASSEYKPKVVRLVTIVKILLLSLYKPLKWFMNLNIYVNPRLKSWVNRKGTVKTVSTVYFTLK